MAKYIYEGRYSNGFFSSPSKLVYKIVNQYDDYTRVYKVDSRGREKELVYTIVSERDSGTYVYEGAYSSGGFFSSPSKPVYKIVNQYDDYTRVYKVDSRGREKELVYTIVSERDSYTYVYSGRNISGRPAYTIVNPNEG